MSAKHTPVPWRAGEVRHAGRYQLVESDGLARGYVCEVQAHEGVDLAATVALIAAAPDFAEVVAEYVAEVDRDGFPSREWSDANLAKMRAALRRLQ